MAIDLSSTRFLIGVMEQSYPPQTLFRDTFFPNTTQAVIGSVDMEYKKGGRAMAPFIVSGSGGRNMERGGFTTKSYKPPTMRPKRILTVDEAEKRAFGENLYSAITPAQREMQIVSNDLAELQDMNVRRIEWMCANIMVYGKFDVIGYADDGTTQMIDTVTYDDWTQKLTLAGDDTWDNENAAIYDNMLDASRAIQRNSGAVPDVALMSFDTSKKILKNKQILQYLMIPSPQNMQLMSIQPRITAPGIMRIGYIQSLNLELFAYDGVYFDAETGQLAQYIPDNYFVMGVRGRGKQLFAAVSQYENKQLMTYAAQYVPKITVNEETDIKNISMSTKCVPNPGFIDDWYTIKVG